MFLDNRMLGLETTFCDLGLSLIGFGLGLVKHCLAVVYLGLVASIKALCDTLND